jgi:transcriptional regulator with XRE-family HTH domain
MDVAELRKIFSARIRKLREGAKLNQGEFADTTGVSHGAMSYYLDG